MIRESPAFRLCAETSPSGITLHSDSWIQLERAAQQRLVRLRYSQSMSTSNPVKHTQLGDLGDAKSVGIWIRVSTEDQARGESPEHHEHRARAYAEAKGWRVREVYHLEAVSGKSVMGHPEAERMLEHVRSGHITGLIFSKLARLARNTRELLDFADIFREHEADLISLQEAIDTSSAAGRLFYTMIAAMAEWERSEISERVAASVPIRARLGKHIGGVAPFGYRLDGRQLVPDPQEAPVRKLMYELFLEHGRKKTVARILNERGYRTRAGKIFTNTSVDRLLRDPMTKGLRRANYSKSMGPRKHWVMKPEKDWVLTPMEPIVPAEVWDRVNAVLDERREKAKRPTKRAVHLFAGKVTCICGAKMYVGSDSPKYVCKACRNKIPTGDLEAVFQEQLRGFFFSPEEVARYLTQADEAFQVKAGALESLENDQAKVQAEMAKLYRLYQADQISPEGFGREYQPLEERLRQIEAERPRVQGEIDFIRIQNLSRDEILSEARDLYSRWPDLAFEERRQVIESIVDRIVIGKDEVEIHLFYLPSAAEIAGNGERNHTSCSPQLMQIEREM
jgi:site-specific DNA recombinase